MKKLFYFVVFAVFGLSLITPTIAKANQTQVSKQPLSPGITLNKYNYGDKTKSQINHITIDLSNPNATVDIGLPRYNQRMRTTTLATNNSIGDGHRVVGAINAAFFHTEVGINGEPMYLLAKENEIYNSGVISTSNDAYVSKPIAFGITSNGNAEIDTFTTQFKAKLPNQTLVIDGTNRRREANELIVYTPQHHASSTLTNEFGVEYIFQSEKPITSTEFGQTIKGKVVAIHGYNSKGNREIPKNGFVLSSHGNINNTTALQTLKMGEEVTITLGINSKWQDAKFMLASGPMLVKDGKRNLSMNESSWRAKQVTARSAIAISKDKKEAHFITVDSTATSKGMNLMQFADYIASLGYDRALNLDGGGSTTMGYRPYGTDVIKLANRPSAGSERAVSAILEAVSRAPLGDAKHIKYARTNNKGTLAIGEKSSIQVDYVVDAAYNPLNVAGVYLQSKGNLVETNGKTLVAKKAGTEEIYVKHGDTIVDSFKVKIVEPVPYSFTDIGPGFIYAKELSYLYENNIITGYDDNTFRPQDSLSREHAMVILSRYLNLDTTSVEDPGFTDVPKSHLYYNEIAAVANAGYISGKDGGEEFDPSGELTRAQLAKVLVKAFDLEGNADKPFTDLPAGDWAYKYVQALVANNIAQGYEDGSFKPSDPVQRIHFGNFIYNLAH